MKLAEQRVPKASRRFKEAEHEGEISMKERLYGYIDNIGEEMFKMADRDFRSSGTGT
ncbi:MAG: hypothetical protein ACLTBV_19930 [Enterocloster bolteae]